MNERQPFYFPARHLGDFSSAVAALESLGISEAEAKLLIDKAREKGIPIALNQLDEGAPLPHNVYILTLTIDGEARQLARLAREAGAVNVAVIASDTPRQQRFASAFIAEWILAGGGPPAMFRFDPSPDVLRLLKRELGKTPYDMALLAVDAADAARAKPYVGTIPSYTSSEVNERQSPDAMRDLDNVRFVEIPWLVDAGSVAFPDQKRPDYPNPALERLQTDRVDLIQLHAIGDLGELDLATGTGGALEAAIRARDEGLATAIGITGHGHDAPETHREALRRFDFQAVLTPWSYVLSRRAPYADSYRALAAECESRGVALRLIKTVARRNWPEPEADHPYATWYEPLDDAAQLSAAVSWALAEPIVCGLATPGDVNLLAAVIAAEADRQPVPDAEAVLEAAPDLSSPFLHMTI